MKLDEGGARATRLEKMFAAVGLERTAHVGDPDSTLRPGDTRAERTSATRSTTASSPPLTEPFLPSITLGEHGEASAPPANADLVLGALLGAGGMGVVHGASQRSLGREVAIKRPLGDTSGAALVIEARTMALVEHPNVVPVHALGRDTNGRPVLVMKRIQGASLRELLRDDAHAAWPALLARWGDRQRACVEILQGVCDALTLAHAQGIVHRDVKPENVMVGAFGEVYLLDWGIAHRMRAPDASASTSSGETTDPAASFGAIVGTPGFMAPEMVLSPDEVDARTDVYLLGATLHNVLTGTLRHRGDSFFETLAAALASEPATYGPEVPEDLAALANAATSADPAERPADAAAFRRALAEHARHREALELVRAARDALEAARKAGLGVAEAAPLLSEASVCVAAAARAYASSALVNGARDEVLRASIERDLALESAPSARAHAMQLSAKDPELEQRIDALERAEQESKERLEKLRRAEADADTSHGLRARAIAVGAACAVLTLGSIYRAYEHWGTSLGIDMNGVVTNDVLVLCATGVLGIVLRKTLFANAGNRRLSAVGLGALASVACTNRLSWALGVPGELAFVFTWIVTGTWFGASAVFVHRAFGLVTLVNVVWVTTFAIAPRYADALLPIATITTLAAFAAAVALSVRRPAS